MPARRTRRLSYANVMSSLALLIALGGVSRAAGNAPRAKSAARRLRFATFCPVTALSLS